jgi:trypsin
MKKFLKKIEPRIINGKNVDNQNVHTYFAALSIKGNNLPFCGGSYVGKNIVITAAHCLDEDIKEKELVVQFKKNNINNDGIKFNVKKIIIHPMFNNDTLNNDIAILFLKGNPYNFGIKKLFLLPNNVLKDIYKIGRKGIILGYGYTNLNGDRSFKLQKAEISIIDKEGPMNFYHNESITNNMFLAGDFVDLNNPNDNKDACTGDSGGPFFIWYNNKNYLIGIISWGYGCAVDLYPGVYTKVGNYRKWIWNNAKV